MSDQKIDLTKPASTGPSRYTVTLTITLSHGHTSQEVADIAANAAASCAYAIGKTAPLMINYAVGEAVDRMPLPPGDLPPFASRTRVEAAYEAITDGDHEAIVAMAERQEAGAAN